MTDWPTSFWKRRTDESLSSTSFFERVDLVGDVGLQRLAELVLALLHLRRHVVEVGDHAGGLLVELAQVGVEAVDLARHRLVARPGHRRRPAGPPRATSPSSPAVASSRRRVWRRLGLRRAAARSSRGPCRCRLSAGPGPARAAAASVLTCSVKLRTHLGALALALLAESIDLGHDGRRVPFELGLHGGDQALSELVDLRTSCRQRSSRWTATGFVAANPGGSRGTYRSKLREA